MKITLLLLLLIALIATATGISYLRQTDADIRFNSAHNEVEKIAFGRNADEALQRAVLAERSADKDRGASQGIGRLFIYIALGAVGLSFVQSVSLLKRKK